MGGDGTVTGNVTWLSPAACDPGKQAADLAGGTRNGGQEMRVLVSTVKTTIGRLRAKLGDPLEIATVRESGYRIGGP
jgi:hypothetical protein